MAIFEARILHVSCVVMFHLYSEISGGRVPIEEIVVPPNVCITQECIDAAKTLYEYRNISAKPCDDFYEFVCGGWTVTHPFTDDTMYRSTYWDLTQLNTERVRDILESDSYPAEPKFVKKIKTFYQSCLNRDKQASENEQILLKRLDNWGGWPIATQKWKENKFDWKAISLNLAKTNDIYPLFKIFIDGDYRNASQARLTIDQADDTYCWDHERRSKEDKLKKLIAKGATHIASANNQSVSVKEIERDADRIIRFEAQICKIQGKDKNRLFDTSRFLIKTVNQLQNLTDSVLAVNEFAQIQWLQLLNNFLEESTLNIDANEEIVMINPDYFSKLVELIDHTPQRTLANYLLAHYFLWMGTDKWLKLVDDDSSDEDDDTETDAEEERWKICVDKTNTHFLHAISYLYVKMYLPEDVRQAVKNLTEGIHKSFVEDLEQNEWMDNETRSSAVEKAQHIKYIVGYPDWYDTNKINELYRQDTLGDNYILNLENIERKAHREDLDFFEGKSKGYDLWSSVTIADANNFYQISSVEINAGNFQPPIYVKGRPEALNYGALGSTIGHEITHSFDDIGRKYDGLGILRNWWTNDSLRKFNAKTQCIEEIYSEYPAPELKYEEVWRLDGPGTITENIADIGGLEIALSAFRKYLQQHGPEKKLPGLTKYSSDQLFFIGYGLQFCQSTNSEEIAEIVLTDEHTPERYRVLLTVANSKDFSEAWKCKEGDPMNAPQKCAFW